jgi:hypothetical protein
MEDKEPTVLDYIKSKLMPWKGIQIELPSKEEADIAQSSVISEKSGEEEGLEEPIEPRVVDWRRPIKAETIAAKIAFPWRSISALILALFAQASISPPERNVNQGVGLFALAACLLVWSAWHNEWSLARFSEEKKKDDPLTIRTSFLWIGILVLTIAFFALRDNLFTSINVTLWVTALACIVHAFWLTEGRWRVWLGHFRDLLHQRKWTITISQWTLLLLVTFCVILFFRLYRLNTVPPEMTSDHAEKLLDVADVLAGEYHIFFPRNAGREALQMYLDAFIASKFNTGISFITLKIGTAIVGLLALPFIYLLGKELGNRYVGFWAVAFAGVSYWHNVISRVGLRFPFYPFFTAITMYFLLRGIRNSNRNDWILAGLSLGLSFYGYTADRILPLLVLFGVALYLLHRQSKNQRQQTWWHFVILVVVAFAAFVPLLRYIVDDPSAFAYRTLTRMGTLERPYPGPVLGIFLGNLWRAWIMFFWEGGNVWLASIPYYPALGTVAGAMYFLGSILLFIRYLRERNWLDLFILLSIPLLMLPSIMALAFPIENPNLYRTGGAIVPVFLIIGFGMEGLIGAIKTGLAHKWGTGFAWAVGFLLLFWSAVQDYDWVFSRYYQQYRESAWNTTEVGHVIRAFADSVGSGDSAWVVPFPHWVDTRLVGINAGYPIKDYALWPEHLEETLGDTRAKLFIVKPNNQVAIDKLRMLYPEGWFQLYTSQVPTKDFLIFFVPPSKNNP